MTMLPPPLEQEYGGIRQVQFRKGLSFLPLSPILIFSIETFDSRIVGSAIGKSCFVRHTYLINRAIVTRDRECFRHLGVRASSSNMFRSDGALDHQQHFGNPYFGMLLELNPHLPLAAVMQTGVHPNATDSFQFSFDSSLSAFQYAGNFDVRDPLKLEQHDLLHRLVRKCV
jgi:hypothetical protein